jgi:hypothetical protein
MKYRAPETCETGGGNYLSHPGTYHIVITGADENPHNAAGGPIDGFRITAQALEGTVKDEDGKFTEKDKTVDLIFWNPKLTDKNEGLFARQKQGKFFLATGLMTDEQLGGDVDIDLEDAIGRHVIVTLEETEGTGDRKFLQLHFSSIWHIDDPAVAKFPQCAKSKGLIPKAHRRDPKSFGSSKAPTAPKQKQKEKAVELIDDI